MLMSTDTKKRVCNTICVEGMYRLLRVDHPLLNVTSVTTNIRANNKS